MISSCCNSGSEVTVTETPSNVVIVVDGTPTLLPRLADCDGDLHEGGARVPTCAQMNTAIADAIAAIPPNDNQILTAADGSVDVTGPNNANNNYTVAVKVDPAANNMITLTSNGLLVTPPVVDDNQILTAADDSVDVTGPNNANNNYTVAVKVDPAANNMITLTANGLLVTPPTADDNQILTAADVSVDVTGPNNANNNYTVAAKISASPSNYLDLASDGLRVLIPDAPLVPSADVNTLDPDARGLVIGLADITPGGPTPGADFSQTNANLTPVALRDLDVVFGARHTGSSRGLMNPDGRIGFKHYNIGHNNTSATFAADFTQTVLESNGARVVLTLAAGSTVAMPPPDVGGVILHLRIIMAANNEEAVLNFTGVSGAFLGGVYRNRQHRIVQGAAGSNHVIVRAGENLILKSRAAGIWEVEIHEVITWPGILNADANWREAHNGRVDIWGTGANPNFPVVLTNTNYTVSGPFTAKTVTGFGNTSGGDYQLTNGIMDYAAFGGIASF